MEVIMSELNIQEIERLKKRVCECNSFIGDLNNNLKIISMSLYGLIEMQKAFEDVSHDIDSLNAFVIRNIAKTAELLDKG